MTCFNRAHHPLPPGALAGIRARALSAAASTGTLAAGVALFPCAFGRTGIRPAKREGDGATPAGRFPLRMAYYRADRGPRPLTGLPVRPITPDLGWCDDPAHPLYNRPVRLPFAARHERMWRDDRLYDLVVIIGHNDAPPLPGAGSAIFLHLAHDDLRPTEGCIALARADLRRLLARLSPRTVLTIGYD